MDSARKNGLYREKYEYNAFGKPVRISFAEGNNGFAVERYLLWDGDALLAQLNPNGQREVDHAYLPGTIDRPFAHTLGATTPTTVRYHEVDELGNVIGTSEAGAVSQSNGYDPWGNLSVGGNFDSHLFWKGLFWHDSTTGLYYMRNRWYDPETGRFVNEDPAGFAGGTNLYAFAGSDPVNWNDPTGLSPEACHWVGGDNTYSGGLGVLFIFGSGYWDCLPTVSGDNGYSSNPSMGNRRRGGSRGSAKGNSPSTIPCPQLPFAPSNLGQYWGEEATEYWARVSTSPTAPWYQKTGGALAGLFSSLWTPDTMNRTVGYLLAGYGARITGPFRVTEMPHSLSRMRESFRFDHAHHNKAKYHIDGTVKKGPVDIYGCKG